MLGKAHTVPSAGRWGLAAVLFVSLGFCVFPFLQEAAAQQAAVGPAQIETYFADHERQLERALQVYNKTNKIVTNSDARWRVDIQAWRVIKTTSDGAFVLIDYAVGDKAWGPSPGQVLFELAWADGELSFVGYQRHWVEPGKAKAAAQPSADAPLLHARSVVEGYFESKEHELGRRLGHYNQKHRYAVPGSIEWQVRSFSWKI